MVMEHFARQGEALAFGEASDGAALQVADVPSGLTTIHASTLEALQGRYGPSVSSPTFSFGDVLSRGLPRWGGRLVSGMAGGLLSPSPAGGGRVKVALGPDLRAVGAGAEIAPQHRAADRRRMGSDRDHGVRYRRRPVARRGGGGRAAPGARRDAAAGSGITGRRDRHNR